MDLKTDLCTSTEVVIVASRMDQGINRTGYARDCKRILQKFSGHISEGSR
jgi:hypothetical protein